MLKHKPALSGAEYEAYCQPKSSKAHEEEWGGNLNAIE